MPSKPQDNASEIPAEIKMVRIPCTGRISKALFMKAFEMGADGVALECEPAAELPLAQRYFLF